MKKKNTRGGFLSILTHQEKKVDFGRLFCFVLLHHKDHKINKKEQHNKLTNKKEKQI